MPERLFRVGQRKEIVNIPSRDTCPAEMVRYPEGADASRESLHLSQEGPVDGIRRSYRHRHSMEDDRIPLSHLVQDPQGAAPRVQKDFGNDLEPIDLRSVPENMAEMCGPEAHSQA